MPKPRADVCRPFEQLLAGAALGATGPEDSPSHRADVTRQAADLVLLQHDLGVLRDGVREGRRTLLNVTTYIQMATSSNSQP